MNDVMSLPASGMCLIDDPMTYPSATGTMCVTPSPESMTVPVSLVFDMSPPFLDHEATIDITACTAIYIPGTLNDSKKTSARYSLFSGGFIGGSVNKK